MALILVDYYKHQFDQFWAQGCRPRVLLSASPLNKWPAEERKPGVELIDFRVRFRMPEDGFAKTLDGDVRRKVHAACFETYIKTYFRDWGTQVGWEKSWLDINNHFEASLQYYWNLIERNSIRIAIFNDAPHLGSSIILYKLCEIMGVVPVVCMPSPFPNALWFGRGIEQLGVDSAISDQTPLRFDIADRPARPSYMKARARLPVGSLLGGLARQASSLLLKTVTLGFLWNPNPSRRISTRCGVSTGSSQTRTAGPPLILRSTRHNLTFIFLSNCNRKRRPTCWERSMGTNYLQSKS